MIDDQEIRSAVFRCICGLRLVLQAEQEFDPDMVAEKLGWIKAPNLKYVCSKECLARALKGWVVEENPVSRINSFGGSA
jgi:hypothetical protein